MKQRFMRGVVIMVAVIKALALLFYLLLSGCSK
jgi:hypothetical protein